MGWKGIPYPERPTNRQLNHIINHHLQSPTCRIIDRSGMLAYSKHQFFLMETIPQETDVSPEPKRFVLMLLIDYSRGELLFKEVEESMGPQEWDCPMRIMQQIEGHPTLGEHSAQWRERVLQYHRDMKPKKAVLRKLRQDHPQGQIKLMLTDGRLVTYEKCKHRGRQNVSAYRDPHTQTLTILHLAFIDAQATQALWTDTGP